MTATPLTTTMCPLCGRNNQCAVEAGLDISACWCASAAIGEAALQAIPPHLRGLSCICPSCAARLKSAAEAARMADPAAAGDTATPI